MGFRSGCLTFFKIIIGFHRGYKLVLGGVSGFLMGICSWGLLVVSRDYSCYRVHTTYLIRDAGVNGSNRPVLKHGPRSLTYVQVAGW